MYIPLIACKRNRLDMRLHANRYRQPKKDNDEKNNSKFCISFKSLAY